MIKLNNEDKIFACIINGLKQTLFAHGTIYNNRKSIRSAAKRILGELKTELHNSKIKNVKRIRTQNGYAEIDAKT